jgi:hypothetical protein
MNIFPLPVKNAVFKTMELHNTESQVKLCQVNTAIRPKAIEVGDGYTK